VLHPETRRAAREQVGAKTNGAHKPKGASTPENRAARTTKSVRTTGEHDPKGFFTQQPDTPHKRKWALKRTGHTTRRVRQTRNTGRRAQPKTSARQRSTTERVLHPEIRHTGALREHRPGACVTSGTGRTARRTAVAVCRRPREGDACEQDGPSTCAQTGMSGVPAGLGRSGSLARSQPQSGTRSGSLPSNLNCPICGGGASTICDRRFDRSHRSSCSPPVSCRNQLPLANDPVKLCPTDIQ